MGKRKKLYEKYHTLGAMLQHDNAQAKSRNAGLGVRAQPQKERHAGLRARVLLYQHISVYIREKCKQEVLPVEQSSWKSRNRAAGRDEMEGAPLEPVAPGQDPKTVRRQPYPTFNDQALTVARRAIVAAAAGMGISAEEALRDPWVLTKE